MNKNHMSKASPSFGGGREEAIHYFNPNHEAAVHNASKHYHQPAQIARMQADLAFLPAWYASCGDFVFSQTPLPDDFMLFCKALNLQIHPVIPADFSLNREMYQYSQINLWGISPQSLHFFEKINEQYKLSLIIPQWKEELRFLNSRFFSQTILAGLLDSIHELEPEILPQFFSSIEAIEQQTVQSQERLLVKLPYSSSGRGLLWLPPGKLAQSERQILSGMLKKQGQVSVEKALDKQLDFAMQFENTTEGETRFIGYSIFQTNAKGAYEKNRIDSQEQLEKEITNLIDPDLLFRTRNVLTGLIQEMCAPYYSGILGVDMLIYQSADSYRLHPCIEINLRNNMGYLAIRLAENFLLPGSHGEFFIVYNRDPQSTVQKHIQMQQQYPLIIENERIRSGYLSLCPVKDTTNYQAYIIIMNSGFRVQSFGLRVLNFEF